MKIRIEITKEDLQKLVLDKMRELVPNIGLFDEKMVKIQTKSKQNYKSEWEEADFRAIYEKI